MSVNNLPRVATHASLRQLIASPAAYNHYAGKPIKCCQGGNQAV